MPLFAIPFPAMNPVAFALGPVEVHWYGLAYMCGLLFGWLYARSLLSNQLLWDGKSPAGPEIADDLLLWTTLGAKKIPMMSLADVCCAAAPFGLFFGRLANFVNGELWGRASDVPWAMVFPGAGPDSRHPSQLYEAALEGLALFLIIRYFTHVHKVLRLPGYASGIFFAGYALARITAENFRMYDPEHAFSTGILTPGIVYSVPMIAIGIYVIWRAKRRAAA